MQSDANMKFIQRKLQLALNEAMKDTPVVCLLGARQSGKSTLAKIQSKEREYITFDNSNYLQVAKNDPIGFVDGLPDFVTLDEIQRVPELMLAIKQSVDEDRRPGRFLLTGSANLLQLPKLADSLAGRMECIYLNPFAEAEKERVEGLFLKDWLAGNIEKTIKPRNSLKTSGLRERIVAGGYPESNTRSPGRARQWHRQYVSSIIERDIRDVAQVGDGLNVSRLLEMISHRTAQLLNLSALASELKLDRRTVEDYFSILEKLFLVRRLPAWHRNEAKRLIKTPKVYVCDSGLSATLSGLRSENWNSDRNRFGHLLESFVIQQLHAQAGWTDSDLRFWHYRDKDKVEVDCVITQGRKVWGVEVKASATVNQGDGKGLRRLSSQAGINFQSGIVLYAGESVLPLDGGKILAVPISRFWSM